jgi:hypothetical protein
MTDDLKIDFQKLQNNYFSAAVENIETGNETR